MIELYELRQFVAFANAGTLSEAAEILHLSQPALSRNIDFTYCQILQNAVAMIEYI